jgi:hypothetical protein
MTLELSIVQQTWPVDWRSEIRRFDCRDLDPIFFALLTNLLPGITLLTTRTSAAIGAGHA